jgi:2-polyprenyl-3-methyl-5-hydroxy-6-metoxy-1,4-benzoquinol methylase
MVDGCPICKESASKVVYDHLQISDACIVKCGHCAHIYTMRQQGDPENLYADHVYEVVENRDSIFDKILSWEYGKVIKKIEHLKKRKGILLDFGSGKGKLADLAQKQSWKVKCVETAVARAEYAKKIYGLDVDTRFYSSGRLFAGEFDAITLFHVLEHLSNPQDLLTELVKHNLSKDGLVVIEVPNINSLQAYIAGSKWIHLDASHHKSHFTDSQIKRLAERSGLTCRKTTSFSFHLGVLGMTDAFLKLFGYRQNIIYQLKKKKSFGLRLAIFALLPLTITVEFCSSLVNRGGVIRKYFVLSRQN